MALVSYEIARDLKVTQKIGMVYAASHSASDERRLESINWGSVVLSKSDETYIGGKPKKMHMDRRANVRANGMDSRPKWSERPS